MKPQFTITEALVEPVSNDDPCWVVLRHAWLDDLMSQFRSISELPNGWDGDHAARPDYRSVMAAWGLITSLCRANDVTKPHVNPTRNGGVQLEWENGSRYFEIEVVAEHAATFLYSDADFGIEKTGEVFEGESLSSVVRYIRDVSASITGASHAPNSEDERVEAVA